MAASNSFSSAAPAAGDPARPPRLTLRAVLFYQRCDQLSEALIYFGLVFSPWAFGTPQFWTGFNSNQFWSTWVMNGAGYLLGLLLLIKLLIRWGKGHQPARWGRGEGDPEEGRWSARHRAGRVLTGALAVLTLAILGYCLIAGLNARSVYHPLGMDFTYRPHVTWLPHSYDRLRTLQGFANYAALACFFWAVRDWLLGKTPAEARASRAVDGSSGGRFVFPARLRRLLWVVSINGALLGLQGIAQRLSGTTKLLWLVQPRINREAEFQFGPYAYRANAAQYFNLLWPVTLGFWWSLQRALRQQPRPHRPRHAWATQGLLLCVLVMATCAIFSYSRGGAIVAVGNLLAALAILLYGLRRQHPLTRFGVLLFFGAVLAVGLHFSWDKLSERFKDSRSGFTERESTYATARQMARDYPLFGTGPGTFEPVFQLYRESEEEYWPAQLHNDWLETRITFGWLGSGLIAVAFLAALARWFCGGALPIGWRFTALVWLGLAGCLVHARFDFPLQIYSILAVFLVLCAILAGSSRLRA